MQVEKVLLAAFIKNLIGISFLWAGQERKEGEIVMWSALVRSKALVNKIGKSEQPRNFSMLTENILELFIF